MSLRKNNPVTVEEKVKDKKTLLKEQKIKAKKLEKVKSNLKKLISNKGSIIFY